MKFERTTLITFFVCVAIALVVSCNKEVKQETVTEEIATVKAPVKICNPVCDITKTPDLQLVTNAEEVRPLLPDGQIDSLSYFFTKYKVRTRPIKLVQNYTVTAYDLTYYPDWTVGDVINRVTLQCLIENIAPKDCNNDWVFSESQGYLVGTDYYFDGLFEFETWEKGNGNSWKFLYTDHKKKFFPSCVAAYPYWSSIDFCYYDRAIQAQMGDFYLNGFRFPNHDGVFKQILRFNPASKGGCRVVKETNYSNNEKAVVLQISNGAVTIL